MAERTPKPPLADDPAFLASLSDLDKGLIDDPAPAAIAAPRPPLPKLAPPPETPHQRLTPEASAALAAAAAALAAFDAPAEPGSVAAAARASGKTPLDVFSPAKPDAMARDLERQPEVQAAAPESPWRGRLLAIVLMIALMLAAVRPAPGGYFASRWRVPSRAG